MSTELLAGPHLSIASRTADSELALVHAAIEHKVLVDSRAELEAALGRLLALAAPTTPKTLDLIGHTTSDRSLLMLGDWVIDATSTRVTSFFRGLADQDVLGRLGIRAVRLLGCMSADSAHGKWTVCRLADVLGVEVYGTTGLMFASHYDRAGFAEEHRYLLASASQLRANAIPSRPLERGSADDRVLDIDTLPSTQIGVSHPWPIKLAERDDARALLRLIRRRDGSIVPGLLAAPSCEIAFPSVIAGTYHLVQVLLDGSMVRVYPEGAAAPGIVYPVDDPHELARIVRALPAPVHGTTQRSPIEK